MEENVLKLFIENIPHCVWWKDSKCKFLGCNTNFMKATGYDSVHQIIGKTDYDIWKKEEADFFRKIDLEVMSTNTAQLNIEETITTLNEGARWLSTSKTPLTDNANKVIGTIGWYLDITTEKELKVKIDQGQIELLEYSQQLKAVNKNLEVVNLDLEKFTYAASHDLKTPIRTIHSFAGLLKRESAHLINDKSKEFLQIIIDSSKQLNDLVSDILQYARTGLNGKNVQEFTVMDVLNEKLLDLQFVIKEKKAIINCDFPPNTSIKGYKELLGSVFYNIIENGLKFNNSEIPIIDISISENEANWVFKIADNGMGMEKIFYGKIFEPFKRLVGSKYEGSGLGLSICKRIATIHRGEIWVESNIDGGTVFNFTVSKTL